MVEIADEANRTQYGFTAVIDSKAGVIKYGLAKHMRDAGTIATIPFIALGGFGWV